MSTELGTGFLFSRKDIIEMHMDEVDPIRALTAEIEDLYAELSFFPFFDFRPSS